MNSVALWIPIALVTFAVVATLLALWGWLAARGERARRRDVETALHEARAQAQTLALDVARLPDLRERAERAERAVEASRQDASEWSLRYAALDAESARDRGDLVALREQLAASARDLDAQRSRASELDRARAQRDSEARVLAEQLTAAQEALRVAQDTSQAIQRELRDTTQRLTQANAERDAAVTLQNNSAAFVREAQTQLRAAFTEAASKVFDEKSITLDQRILASGEASKIGMEATLKPFAEHIRTFQQRIETLATDQVKGQAELVGKITELKTLNQDMAASASALTQALKGNAKARGDWGELVLDTVLKASGLVEGTNYVRQVSAKDEDTGALKRPDLVVHLPDGRRVVIDSKVNLVAWAEATNAETPDEQRLALLRHAAALRTHMRDLSDKNYPRTLGDDALEMTIAFVPIEGALSQALGAIPELQTEAFAKRVVFASPNTLMAMLQVVERLWTRDKLAKQVSTIGAESGKLLDALIAFLDDFDTVQDGLTRTTKALDAARRRLNDSPQSVVARARRLVEAGAKGRKALPDQLAPAALDAEVVSLLASPDAGSTDPGENPASG